MTEDRFLRGMASDIPLAGNDDQIKTQLSLLLGTAQLMESQSKGLDLDFYKFIALFEDGFSMGFLPKQNTSLNPKYWGQSQKTRPKVRILAESSKNWQNQGFALIELQPDRTIEEQSYLLFGTPMQLIQQIMLWMNLHKKLANLDVNASGGRTSGVPPYYIKGKCVITLMFKGLIDNTIADHKVEKSLRLIKDDPATMSQSRLVGIAQRIYDKFASPLFSFRTGHEAYCYKDPEAGFNRIWGYFASLQDAKKLFEQMLDISGQSPNWKRLTKSVVVEPGDRFSEIPEKVMQVSQPIRTARERPFATVRFHRATIKFPHIRRPIEIIKADKSILKGLKFLNDNEVKEEY